MMLSSSFFTHNRELLRARTGDGLTVITAQSLLQRSGDTVYPFRQDSNFYYLTGIHEPDVVLVMCEADEFLILPKRSESEIVFGGTINCDEIAKKSGIHSIYPHQEGWSRYKKLQQSRKNVYTLGAAATKIHGLDSFYTNPARKNIVQKIKRISSVEIIDIRTHLVQLRQIKQPEEVAVMKRVIAITAEGFMNARKVISGGVCEYELAAEFDYVFAKNQAVHGYQPIIASGANACTLHYIQNNHQLRVGDGILLDVGAEYYGYSADITRTYAITQFSERQQEVYEAVFAVHQRAIELLQPGIKWRDYAQRVEQKMGEELLGLGLIASPSSQEVRRYFSHGISHGLGLDVHDVCDYDTILENMVMTVEPGIYIPEEAIGVRIEDDVLITKNGAENLSSHIPYY